MVTEVTVGKLRQNLDEMLNHVQARNDSIVISKDGKPVAALIDAGLFARIRSIEESFEQLCAKIADAYKDVPEEEGMAEIDAAVEAVRHGR